jgi:prophage tail gpP-like protein
MSQASPGGASNTDIVSLTINGTVFSGWIEMTVSRAIDRLKSVFSLSVSDQSVTNGALSQITPFSSCVVKIGNDTVLTGYVDDCTAEIDGMHHSSTVIGASKTCDLVECQPDFNSGQYKGYTLEQIARAVCNLFGIGVVVQTDASQIFPDVTLQRGETAFTFLERLGRLAGVLLTDDANGNLVLATTGTQRASGSLTQGVNILRGQAKLNVEKQFSVYILKGQKAIGSADASWGGAGGIGSTAAAPSPVATQLRAVANDTSVPRYRPHISLAEAQLDAAGMQRRVNWERNFAAGRAAQATLVVPGWRQPDNTLWQVNQLISVTAPFAQCNQDLLVAETTFMSSATRGRETALRVGPVAGYTPDPGQVKLHVKKGKKGKSAPNWDGAAS